MSLAVFVDDFDECGGAFVVCLLRLEMVFNGLLLPSHCSFICFVRHRVGSELQCTGANVARRRQCGSELLYAGANVGCSSHLFRVCTCLLVRSSTLHDVAYSLCQAPHVRLSSRKHAGNSLQSPLLPPNPTWPAQPQDSESGHICAQVLQAGSFGLCKSVRLGNGMPVHWGQKVAGNSCGGQARRHMRG